MTDQGSLPDDLAGMARRLEAERPVPTGVELERVRHRATVGNAGSTRSQTNRKVGQPMRPRLAILTMLAVGILLMGAGTGLAVSGLSGSENASEVVYPTTETTTTTSTNSVGGVVGGGGTGGLQQANEPAAKEVAQVAAAGDDDSLPFTGFAAIPVIVVGVGLLVGGLVLRRRTSPTP